jgi:hypothetical protein
MPLLSPSNAAVTSDPSDVVVGEKGRMLAQSPSSLDVVTHPSTWHLQILPAM